MKYLRAASPRAKCTRDDPCTSVLSTSKKAAAVRSGGGAGGVRWLAQVEDCRTRAGLACELLIIGVCTRGRLDDVGVGHEFSLSHGAAILA